MHPIHRSSVRPQLPLFEYGRSCPVAIRTRWIFWCPERDSNPHARKRHPLKVVCLPVSTIWALTSLRIMVPKVGLEPTCLTTATFEIAAATFSPLGQYRGIPSGIRTRVNRLRTDRPSPLDDGDVILRFGTCRPGLVDHAVS